MYLHEKDKWWIFSYDTDDVMPVLSQVRMRQGKILGIMQSIGLNDRESATLQTLTTNIVKSAEIEGELLNLQQVRSSIARRLGIATAGLVESSHYIEGVVEMMLDATQRYNEPLSDERLFGWHNTLFPTGRSQLYKIDVGCYRTHAMQVVSGPMGHERVHYEAPQPERVTLEIARFISWLNNTDATDAVLRAAIAHLWFVTIHPFDDGNGRIGRAIMDMMLCRADNTPNRFYSMSAQILKKRNEYYDLLEDAQKGNGDITEWLVWFLHTMEQALSESELLVQKAIRRNQFWDSVSKLSFNERQRKILELLLEDFKGNLTSGKWAKICHCSTDTALNDIKDLLQKGILDKAEEGGRSTNYKLVK
ncbi:MAG: Fic family protein [Bacteroidales bacterium]|nr:Fic family protein [Bacteroidales bacterium]